MPLSDKEKAGFYEILCLIQDHDLISLANTVSHNVLNLVDRRDAVESIVKYASHPFELLKRKKIKRDTLFLYADKFHIDCLPHDTKKELIRKILTAWNSGYDVEEMEEEDIPAESFQPQLTFHPSSIQPQPTFHTSSIQPQPTFHTSSIQSQYPFQQQLLPSQTLNQQLLQSQQQQLPIQQQQNVTQFINQNSIHDVTQPHQQPHLHVQQTNDDIALNCWYDNALQPSDVDIELSLEFCKWFYLMLNNLNNDNANNNNTNHATTLTPHHFFEDCTLNLVTESQPGKRSEVIRGAASVCSRLKDLTTSNGISYNPNMSERGLSTLCDRYGRRVVIVAGTIHAGTHVGLFEQQFGLVRDGNVDYNWKIKFTRLALSNHTPQHPISLENTKHIFSLVPI